MKDVVDLRIAFRSYEGLRTNGIPANCHAAFVALILALIENLKFKLYLNLTPHRP